MVRRIISHPLFVGLVGAVAAKFLPDIIKEYGGTSMEFLYKHLWTGIWPIWFGLAIAIIYWFIKRLLNLYRTYQQFMALQKQLKILLINRAQYGARGRMKDVTEMLRDNIVSNRIEGFQVTNEALDAIGSKDPIKGTRKILSIKYSYCGESLTKDVPEGGILSLPE